MGRKISRKRFVKETVFTLSAIGLAHVGISAKSYNRIIGANERIRVGVIGFSNRFKESLFPAFLKYSKDLNMEIVALSDIWKVNREKGIGYLKGKSDLQITECKNNDELFLLKDIDAVIISTPDFQHARHAIIALNSGCDVYIERPFALNLDENNELFACIKKSDKVVQVGYQQRSSFAYNELIGHKSTLQLGGLDLIEINVNNDLNYSYDVGLVDKCLEAELDWNRFLEDRPFEKWSPIKYIYHKLQQPYSSSLTSQKIVDKIDTIQRLSGENYPFRVTSSGESFIEDDFVRSWCAGSILLEYGSLEDSKENFSVVINAFRPSFGICAFDKYYYKNGMIEIMSVDNNFENLAISMTDDKYLHNFSTKKENIYNIKNEFKNATLLHMKDWMCSVRKRQKSLSSPDSSYYNTITTNLIDAAMSSGGVARYDVSMNKIFINGI